MDGLTPDSLLFPNLPEGASVSSGGTELYINCESIEVADEVCKSAVLLSHPSRVLNLKTISIRVGLSTVYYFPWWLPLHLQSSKEIKVPDIAELATQETQNMIWAARNPIAIVRMSDHKGLFCTESITQASAASPNDWVGADMSRYFPDGVLGKYMDSLEKHRIIMGYSYQAFDFNMERRQITINARLAYYNDDLCRMVETLESVPV